MYRDKMTYSQSLRNGEPSSKQPRLEAHEWVKETMGTKHLLIYTELLESATKIQMSQLDANGNNPFHTALNLIYSAPDKRGNLGNLDNLESCIKILIALDNSLDNKLLQQPNHAGQTPFSLLFNNIIEGTYKKKKDKIAARLAASRLIPAISVEKLNDAHALYAALRINSEVMFGRLITQGCSVHAKIPSRFGDTTIASLIMKVRYSWAAKIFYKKKRYGISSESAPQSFRAPFRTPSFYPQHHPHPQQPLYPPCGPQPYNSHQPCPPYGSQPYNSHQPYPPYGSQPHNSHQPYFQYYPPQHHGRSQYHPPQHGSHQYCAPPIVPAFKKSGIIKPIAIKSSDSGRAALSEVKISTLSKNCTFKPIRRSPDIQTVSESRFFKNGDPIFEPSSLNLLKLS